jgi:hypothetical protein
MQHYIEIESYLLNEKNIDMPLSTNILSKINYIEKNKLDLIEIENVLLNVSFQDKDKYIQFIKKINKWLIICYDLHSGLEINRIIVLFYTRLLSGFTMLNLEQLNKLLEYTKINFTRVYDRGYIINIEQLEFMDAAQKLILYCIKKINSKLLLN